jgi:hypothetical protein
MAFNTGFVRGSRFACRLAPAALAITLVGATAHAQQPGPAASATPPTAAAKMSPPSTEEPAQEGWGFTSALGEGGTGGDFGQTLDKPITGEFNIFRQSGAWRFGAGVAYGSYKMKKPYQDEPEWGSIDTYLFATRMLRTHGFLRPYIQVRGGLARLHPRSFLFEVEPPPEDLQPGESTTKAANGFMVGVVPGLELKLSRAAYLDASVLFKYFSVDDYDLSPVGLPPTSSGTAWEARLGVTWFPNGGQSGKGNEGGPRDAWGVKKSFGWAAGETLAINNVASITTEYIRKVNFSQISPRSWWHNIDEGFTWDDNEFKTNQYIHPFNGAAYYNSGRANGLGFWESSIFASAGAFYWECCGETHPMSFNDIMSTGLGGIALGEAQYRLSSEILNNQTHGMGRFWSEFGAFLVDPIRGFNRLVTGDAKTTADNPVDPMDWRPKGGRTFVATGFRSIGEGSSITNDTKSYYTILLNHNYGDVFENTRRKPFDYMEFVGELNFGEKVGLGNVQIRGDLASWPLGGPGANHVVSVVQYFDYMNNTAYEFGGQSLGAALSSRFRLSDRLGLTTRVDGSAILLGAVNADYSWLADVAEQERIREYDYGPGAGGTATATLSLNGHPLLAALYRFEWISVKNGSVYDKGTVGSDADHYVQMGGLRLVVPIKGNLGVGADAYVFLRDSHYSAVDSATGDVQIKNVTQRNPQVRVYLSMSNTR